MVFSYETYWINTFLLPAAMIICMIVALFVCSYGYWVGSRVKNQKSVLIYGYLFCILIVVCCMIPQCQYLLNGGAVLLGETEEDAVIQTGIIESVCEPSERFPGFKSSHRYGADIIIDGELYFAVTSGDFEEGECVTIHYLPSSHFILEIDMPGGT